MSGERHRVAHFLPRRVPYICSCFSLASCCKLAPTLTANSGFAVSHDVEFWSNSRRKSFIYTWWFFRILNHFYRHFKKWEWCNSCKMEWKTTVLESVEKDFSITQSSNQHPFISCLRRVTHYTRDQQYRSRKADTGPVFPGLRAQPVPSANTRAAWLWVVAF